MEMEMAMAMDITATMETWRHGDMDIDIKNRDEEIEEKDFSAEEPKEVEGFLALTVINENICDTMV